MYITLSKVSVIISLFNYPYVNMKEQTNIIVHDYNGFNIPQRESDSYVNLTAMAKIYGKQVCDWTRYNDFKSYSQEVALVTGINRSELLVITKGGNQPQGTWGHRLIALAFAKWLNPAFHVWCNQHLLELIETGITKLEPEVVSIQKESEDFWYYLEKLMELKPMLHKDVELAKQMFKRLYENY